MGSLAMLHLTSQCLALILAAAAIGQEPGTIVEYDESIRDFLSEGTGQASIDLPAYFEQADPDVAVWYQHVNTLANPWMQGRQPGTRGDDLASEYMEFYMKEAGMKPAFIDENGEPSWRQPFRFQISRRAQPPVLKSASVMDGPRELIQGKDFNVLANSGNGTVTGPMTFVGYAIEDGVNGYESFGDDDDLTGRIAIMLRYEPLDGSGISRWADENFSSYSGIRGKMQSLIDRNAAGIIMVTPPKAIDARSGLETLQSTTSYRPRAEVPVIHMTADEVDELLKKSHPDGLGLSQMRKAADRDTLDTFDLDDDELLTISTSLTPPGIQTRNVAGIIPGKGSLADEWLVIGGHYDHLGTGYTGSRRRGSNEYHNGADDNASGIASMLVMADRLSNASELDVDDRRSVLFIGFGAEEAGLHGSDHFVENPPMDLDSVSCMLNFDMMGRLGENGLQMLGTGTAEEFDEMLPRFVGETTMVVNATPSGTGPSDHTNFYNKEIPVLFFFSGITDEYHTPDDDAWTVNPEGAVAIIDLAEMLAEELITRDDMLTFRESTEGSPRRRTDSSVRLGVMPGYGADLDKGVMIEAVSGNTAAEEAGIEAGDILMSWNNEAIDGPGGLMSNLRTSKPGDEIEIVLLRDGMTMKTVTVKLRSIED
ncbi:MAG: M28 family peptidase, partial [Phycisphaerales bacterium]|nr:M28 family peptidase [Phycisphaerales bacterium]